MQCIILKLREGRYFKTKLFWGLLGILKITHNLRHISGLSGHSVIYTSS